MTMVRSTLRASIVTLAVSCGSSSNPPSGGDGRCAVSFTNGAWTETGLCVEEIATCQSSSSPNPCTPGKAATTHTTLCYTDVDDTGCTVPY